jgi:hypothetical protein
MSTRRPTIERVLAGALHNAELVEDVLDALTAADLRIILARRPMAHAGFRTLSAREGQITSRTLIDAAAEYDEASDGTDTSAAEFVAWFLIEVEDCVEHKWLAEQRRKL